MLYAFLLPLAKQLKVLNVLTYISFRAVGGAVTALLLSFVVGPIILAALKRESVSQGVRDGTPDSHAKKGATPTMGGLIILNSALISVALWGASVSRHLYLYVAVATTLWMGLIGFVDDVLKLRQKRRANARTAWSGTSSSAR